MEKVGPPVPAAIPVVYTPNSMVGDLSKTACGRKVLEQLMAAAGESNTSGDLSRDLGEGSERMMEAVMREMPIGALVAFGQMTEIQLMSMLQQLNGSAEK